MSFSDKNNHFEKTPFRQTQHSSPVNRGPLPAKPESLPLGSGSLLKENKHGFTLFEIVVVLVLMSIVAAAVLGRSIDTREIDLNGQSDKIRNHIRYAQAMAMKRSDSVWGITCTADPNQYWVFQGTNPDDTGKQLELPGENDTVVSLAESNVSVSAFTLFFDRFGRPYSAYTDENTNTPVTSDVPFVITVSALSGGISPKTLHITAETGFVQ